MALSSSSDATGPDRAGAGAGAIGASVGPLEPSGPPATAPTGTASGETARLGPGQGPGTPKLVDVLQRALHPPVGDPSFWMVQASVLALTLAHFLLDSSGIVNSSALASLPVAALFVPVAYAALRYGLHGSAATALWATVLWLPDLTIRHHHGDPGADLVSLLLIDTVAVVVGQRIERENLARTTAALASARRAASDARYRQLYAATRAPILLFNSAGGVLDANPAAWAVFGTTVLEATMEELIGLHPADLEGHGGSGRVNLDVEGKPAEFRYLSSLTHAERGTEYQVLLQDVTAERRAWRDVQAYAAALLGAQEEERARLARELHDDPLQSIVHVARHLELLGARAPLDAQSTGRLRSAHDDLLETARRLRDLAQGLRPPALERLGLVAALEGLAADEEDRADNDVQIKFEVHGQPRRLVPECELGLYRIAQEALHNALTHGSPGRLTLSISYQDALVCLCIWNDGPPFEPGAAPATSRLGLRGMRERASLLGGTLVIDSTVDCGTSVTASVPLREASLPVSSSLEPPPVAPIPAAGRGTPPTRTPRG